MLDVRKSFSIAFLAISDQLVKVHRTYCRGASSVCLKLTWGQMGKLLKFIFSKSVQ